MRIVISLLLALFIAVGGALFLRKVFIEGGDPGYVLIGHGQWSVETSLLIMILIVIASFVAFYFTLRLLGGIFRLPGRIKRRSGDKKIARSQQALIDGVIDSAEGNWERAERVLIKHAANSGMPLIHYLTAAKAAQSRGAYQKRDEYLRLAQESTLGADFAVGLAQAELHLSEQQFDAALESLTQLNSMAPAHASILKLLHQTYAALEDWESVRKLIPSLHKNKVLMEAEIKLLETETYSALLKQKAELRDGEEIMNLWASVPKHIQEFSGVNALYFASMIEAGAGSEIEHSLVNAIKNDWNETLLVLYGCIESDKSKNQLKQAEKWLKNHPQDAVLLRVLGKLCLRQQLWEKAEKFLGGSIGIEPTVEAYRLLGDYLSKQNDKERASECYRRGLMLASEEVIKNVDHLTDEDSDSALNNQAPPLLANETA